MKRIRRITIRSTVIVPVLLGHRLNKGIAEKLKNAGVVVCARKDGLQMRVAINLEPKISQRPGDEFAEPHSGQVA